MKITSFERDRIENGLKEARHEHGAPDNTVRIIFSPFSINESNFTEACTIFSQINHKDYDTVVVVESHPGSAEKKLPMPSFKEIQTTFGRVSANDKLRNDFADEDDDFFVNDDAFDEDVSLYDQLTILQAALDDFSVLSIQITDENSFIVKELAYALEEILASKNALLVFCCDLNQKHTDELERITQWFDSGNMTSLMNYLNSGESNINGVGTFVAGLLVARKWGLSLHFCSLERPDAGCENLLSGYAVMQKQPIFG